MSKNIEGIKDGDYVRVVLEGRVFRHYGDRLEVGEGNRSNVVFPEVEHVVSIEKIDPPVEYFKPGDRIRYLSTVTPFEVTLGDEGYLQHFAPTATGHSAFFRRKPGYIQRGGFHSGLYELVYRNGESK